MCLCFSCKAVLTSAQQVPSGSQKIKGWDFDKGCSLDGIMEAMFTTGIQATALGRAVKEVRRMVRLDAEQDFCTSSIFLTAIASESRFGEANINMMMTAQ